MSERYQENRPNRPQKFTESYKKAVKDKRTIAIRYPGKQKGTIAEKRIELEPNQYLVDITE